jgi:hypothetical protein
MRVRVSDRHINDSVRGDSHHCMIADAIKDAHPTAQYIQADVQSIRFSDPLTGKRYTYLTPPVAQSALLQFDAGTRVKPFAFTLRAPVIARPIGWIGQRSPTASRKGRAYRKTGIRRSIVTLKERVFGLRRRVVRGEI